jgi:hypothetical protein
MPTERETGHWPDEKSTWSLVWPPIVALVIVLAWAWWAFGFHIVHKRPDWQYFGCEHTHINDKGEDTGECR